MVVYFSSSGDEIAELEIDWSEYLESQEAALADLVAAFLPIRALWSAAKHFYGSGASIRHTESQATTQSCCASRLKARRL